MRAMKAVVAVGWTWLGLAPAVNAAPLATELQNLGFVVVDNGVGVSGLVSTYFDIPHGSMTSMPVFGPGRVSYPNVGTVPSPGGATARLFDEGVLAYKIQNNNLVVALAAGLNPQSWPVLSDFNNRAFGQGDLYLAVDAGGTVQHYALLNSLNSGNAVAGHGSYYDAARGFRDGSPAGVGQLVRLAVESGILRTGLNNAYRFQDNAPNGLDTRLHAQGGTNQATGSVAFSTIVADQPLGNGTAMTWHVATWTVPLIAFGQNNPFEVAYHAVTSCGNDQINGKTTLPGGCATCDMCATTSNGGAQIKLVSRVFNGTNTTFTYRVCQSPAAQDLSHWVLGLSSTCVNSVVGSSGGTLGTDPTTGVTGIKFETPSGVPDCGAGCGETGDLFTVTFSGSVGTGCNPAATKAGQAIAFACVQGPNCNAECVLDGDCDDGDVCTTDTCNLGVCNHSAAPNGTACDDGSVCTTGDTCQGGVCTGGSPLSCDDTNVCTDDSCHATMGCQHSNNMASCDDGNACTTNDRCSGGTCVGGAPPNCDDDNPCTDDSCDPMSGCQHVNNTVSCNDGNACTTMDTCSGGMCVGGPAPNCDDGNVCTDDSCHPMLGCQHTNNTAPCSDENACTVSDTCANGMCVGGPPLTCDDGNVCTNDSCDMALGCVFVNNSSPCSDGNACTTNDTCANGMCVGGAPPDCDDDNDCTGDSCHPMLGCQHVNLLAGTPCGDSADTNCDNPDTCNGIGGCNNNHEFDDTPCEDGTFCNGEETCQGGVCTAGTPVPDCCKRGNECTNNNVCDGLETCVNHACVPGTPLDCDDDNPCTDDSCHPTLGCQHVDNTAPCDDGNACTTMDTCSGGMCVGGAPPDCDDGNVCTDDGCDPMTGCTHVNNTASCSDMNACTTGDTCANGMCVGGPPPDCDDGNPCTNDGCDPMFGCKHVNSMASCDDGNACTTFDTCSGGMCVGGAAPNCDDMNPCTDDSCHPMSGCQHADNMIPCTDGNACTTMDTCSGGMCVGGAPPICDDGNVCTDDSCDPMMGCQNVNNLASCDDANACTTMDTCSGGMCVGGPPPICDDGNVCTDDSCDPMSGCQNVDNMAPCSDGNACTTMDTCSGGMCVGGPPLHCDDNNVCTDDSCDPMSGCQNVNNMASCSDGNACTTMDTCSGGMCVGGPPPNCDDGNACTDDSCDPMLGCRHEFTMAGAPCGSNQNSSCDNPDSCDGNGLCAVNNEADGTPCPDGVFCNGDETCLAGMCTPGTPVPACCDFDSECDNNSVCDGSETCVSNKCVPGTPLDCDDGNVCTDDPCDPLTGCFHTDNTAPCTDGNACTANDACAGGMCVAGPPPNCDDGNVCTDDSCDSMLGCVTSNNTQACSDGNACTTNDICQGGTCVGGPPPMCDDANGCTTDGCNPMIGCQNIPNAEACSDGNACTTNDSCAGGRCVGGPALVCDDGQFCNGSESCSPASGCVAGTAPNCSDAFACTLDSCNESSDGCDHVPNNAACDDALFCNGAETCSVASGCVAGTPPNCNDGVGCTVDSCNESADSCVHAPDSAACNNGQFCDGVEICHPTQGCQSGAAPNCADSVNCTMDSCNETTDQCDHLATNALCVDALFCNGSETCNAALGCQAGTNPCTDPLLSFCDETDDSCVECLVDGHCIDDGLLCTTEACVGNACSMAAAVYDVPVGQTVGFRSISVTPQPPGSTHPVALVVTSPNFPCLLKYVSDNGTLVASPVFQPPAAWGVPDSGTVTISNQDIIPSANNNPIEYWIQADCGDGPPSYTAPGMAIPPLWGDVNVDGFVNLDDIICELDAFAGLPTPLCTFTNMNIAPCTPDGFLNSDDVLYVLNAFTGQQYPCAIPCDGGACCVNNACFLYVPGDCTAANGTFLGPGSVCDVTTCLPSPASDAVDADEWSGEPPLLRLVPRRERVSAGTDAVVDVFIENVSDLRSYEVALDLSDRRGMVTVIQLSIERNRPDYVFGGLTEFTAVNDRERRMLGVLVSGGVASPKAYLGTLTLRTAPRSSGSLTVTLRSGETSTFLRNANSQAIPVTTGPAATLWVESKLRAAVVEPGGSKGAEKSR